MDLVAGVRKEGSRGGRGDFKWEDVKGDQHRENYLGHSLMAPVGRWQRNRDLSWYATSTTSPGTSTAAHDARAEELRLIKEAEQDALSAALGFPVAPKALNSNANPNLVPVAERERDIKRAVQEAGDRGDGEEGDEEGGRGVGFGATGGGVRALEGGREVLKVEEGERRGGLSGGVLERGEEKGRKRSRERRKRSRSRHRRYEDEERRGHRRRRSRSRDGGRHRDSRRRSRSRSRSRSYDRRRERDGDRYPRQRRERRDSPPRRRREGSWDRGYDRRR